MKNILLSFKKNAKHQLLKNSTFIIRYSFITKFIFFFLFVFCTQLIATAQNSGDLTNIRTEELTDDQIRRFIIEADRLALKDDQIEQAALQRGMNPIEVVKLKDRMQATRKALSSANYQAGNDYTRSSSVNNTIDSVSALEQKPLDNFNTLFTELKTKNFGFDVFNNRRLTFEPNLKLPTPLNYRLAADDENIHERDVARIQDGAGIRQCVAAGGRSRRAVFSQQQRR